MEATRFLDGGRLVVGAWQGPATGLSPWVGVSADYVLAWPTLATMPLGGDELAALAADPAMLPA